MPRSPVLLVTGLVALALGFFLQWRGWWNGVFELVGVVFLVAWVYGSTPAWGAWMRERRWVADRRRRAMRVGVERRHFERRAAA